MGVEITGSTYSWCTFYRRWTPRRCPRIHRMGRANTALVALLDLLIVLAPFTHFAEDARMGIQGWGS